MSYINPEEDEISIQSYNNVISRDRFLEYDILTTIPNYHVQYPHERHMVSYPYLFDTYVKLPISPHYGYFLIDNGVYERIKDKLQQQLSTPIYGIHCQTITIRPDPKTNTHYFFQYEGCPTHPKMQSVGWFHSTDDKMKLTVSCPFYDSYYSGVSEKHFVIPWYRQTHFATSEVVADNFISPVPTNTNHGCLIPFLSPEHDVGLFFFTGIKDTIGFYCTVLLNQTQINPDVFNRDSVKPPRPSMKRSHHKH